MQTFFLKAAEGGWELVGAYDMAQVPKIGEKILLRAEGVLKAMPIVDVQHFLTSASGIQGAFLHVEDGLEYDVPPEMASFFSS